MLTVDTQFDLRDQQGIDQILHIVFLLHDLYLPVVFV